MMLLLFLSFFLGGKDGSRLDESNVISLEEDSADRDRLADSDALAERDLCGLVHGHIHELVKPNHHPLKLQLCVVLQPHQDPHLLHQEPKYEVLRTRVYVYEYACECVSES